jgi:hypothetical protein
MKNIKLNAVKALFMITLLCSAVFAEGDQGSGGFAGTDTTVVKTTEASVDGDQGSGGFSANSTQSGTYFDSLMSVIEDWIGSMV